MSSVSFKSHAYSNYSQLQSAVAFKGKPVTGFWQGLPTPLITRWTNRINKNGC